MALPPILRDRLRLPVIASPLFIISGPELVIAQCKAGIVGSFPSLNARPISMLDEWLHRHGKYVHGCDRKRHLRAGELQVVFAIPSQPRGAGHTSRCGWLPIFFRVLLPDRERPIRACVPFPQE